MKLSLGNKSIHISGIRTGTSNNKRNNSVLMPFILQKWATLVSTTLNPLNMHLSSFQEEAIELIIKDSESEQEHVRSLLIEGITDIGKIRDKQEFVQFNQALLIRLIDKIHSYKQVSGLSEKVIHLYDSISHHLEETLNFIEEFFGNYFDRNEKVPVTYLSVAMDELCNQLELLKLATSSNAIDPKLANVIFNNFEKFCLRKSSVVSYNELIYQKDLMSELLTDQTLSSNASIWEVLFYFNFNDDNYMAYLFKHLENLTSALPARNAKIAALRLEQKNINQLRTRLDRTLSANMPGLKEQVNQWIEEEIKFFETENLPEPAGKQEFEPDEKIQTSLSVAKLALLIKLMVIDKVITNRVVATVLRASVKIFTTLQQENVSFHSLENKYHNPDRGTITAIKDMLFRWINILNKL